MPTRARRRQERTQRPERASRNRHRRRRPGPRAHVRRERVELAHRRDRQLIQRTELLSACEQTAHRGQGGLLLVRRNGPNRLVSQKLDQVFPPCPGPAHCGGASELPGRSPIDQFVHRHLERAIRTPCRRAQLTDRHAGYPRSPNSSTAASSIRSRRSATRSSGVRPRYTRPPTTSLTAPPRLDSANHRRPSCAISNAAYTGRRCTSRNWDRRT